MKGESNYGNMVFEWDGVVDPRVFFRAKFDRWTVGISTQRLLHILQLKPAFHTAKSGVWTPTFSYPRTIRTFQSIQVTTFSFKNSSSPALPLNRPKPLFPTPPCGSAGSSCTVMLLMWTALGYCVSPKVVCAAEWRGVEWDGWLPWFDLLGDSQAGC